MTIHLSEKRCVACEGGTPAFTDAQIEEYKPQIEPAWQIRDDEGIKKLYREFKFKDFKAAMEFVNAVAEIAESEGHHPDLYIFYNLVKIELYTHAVRGLFENDFIIAAKIDNILSKKV